MTHTEHPRHDAFTLFLAFAGGALVGGVAALLFAPRSGAETRGRITGAVDETKEFAAHVPGAIREAACAAQAAFAAALKASTGEEAPAATPPRAVTHHA